MQEIAKSKKIDNYQKTHLQSRIVRELNPELHQKTHFKAAASLIMKDTPVMSNTDYDNAVANDLIRQSLDNSKLEVERQKISDVVFNQ